MSTGGASAVAAPRRDLWPSVAVAVSGAAWGVFWLPMQRIEGAGVAGAWAAIVVFTPVAAALAPVCLWRWRRLAEGGVPLLLAGLLTGIALACYAASLVLTDVVRAILLFYLTPVWGTVLGRVHLGEPITPARRAALALGVGGLWILIGDEAGLPVPRNVGDWLALASGIAWAFGSLELHRGGRGHALDAVFAFFAFGTLASFALALAPLEARPGVEIAAPGAAALLAAAPWAALVGPVLTLPTMYAILWAAYRISPARIGLLLMGEVVVGVATAALWSGDPFGAREALGTVLIVGAGLVEVLGRREAEMTHEPA